MNNEALQVMGERLNIMEHNIQRLSSAVERISMSLALNKGGGGGGSAPHKFISIDEQIESFLASSISPQQLAILRTGKRDESTTKLRSEVICSLYKKGISANKIASILNKDHNCIFYHLAMNNMVDWKRHKQVRHRKASKEARAKRKARLALLS